jgi:hypothetical protein
MVTTIKNYCKIHKLKFIELTKDGFIASSKVAIKAGMEYDIHTSKLLSIPIRKIGTKVVYSSFILHSDGDIEHNGKVNNFNN